MSIHGWRGRIVATVALGTTALVGETVLAQNTWRVSVDSSGTEADGSSSRWEGPSISADGRFVAFDSNATNLVPGDTNNDDDVFVHDRLTGATTRVSVNSSGVEGDSDSLDPSISGDGRFVAFESGASNLVKGDSFGQQDVFVHDRLTGVTTLASVDPTGSWWGLDGYSGQPSISSDGNFVAFMSAATYLVPGDTNGTYDIFVYDRQANTTVRVSVDSAGVEGNDYSSDPSISADGRFVAFESDATNLVPGDTNGQEDVFLHDLLTGTTTRVSVDSSGAEADSWSRRPGVSGDGRLVAFYSDSTNLVSGDTNSKGDVFVHDWQAGTTTRVSLNSKGREANGSSSDPSLSWDGRYVSFLSRATNMVLEDTNGEEDVFWRDTTAGVTRRFSVNSKGTQANADSRSDPVITSDGRFVAFSSYATNLVQLDLNRAPDIFVHGPHLTLEATPEIAAPGSSLSFTSWTGMPTALAMLVAVDISGNPTYSRVTNGTFDSSGLWTVAGTVPPSLSGLVITFATLGINPDGKAEMSNLEAVTFS